jgi:hypothetical protein
MERQALPSPVLKRGLNLETLAINRTDALP